MPAIDSATALACRIPTDVPEADGTLAWHETTLVVVEIAAAGQTGLGFAYADACLVPLLERALLPLLLGDDPRRVGACRDKVARAVRNLHPGGLAGMAVSAIDLALWDLSAKLHQTPLAMMLGPCREAVPVYGSGGFTHQDDDRLRGQLGGWAGEGMTAVKMKVGSDPGRDPERVRVAREAIGPEADLFVDANGAYDTRQALRLAFDFAEAGVTLFEEPVSSDDLAGLRFLREHGPAGVRIAAGEYCDSLEAAARMLDAQAVDVLQIDITRCGGLTVFMEIGALCRARHVPLFAHCGPAFHLAPALALPAFGMLEGFHDHFRIERMLLDGLPELKEGKLWPRLDRPGHGLALQRAATEKYQVA
jgi:L-alanine-DL-glutamate epimerase-like enolase superfamily enzyme